MREFHAEELRTAELLGRLALRLMCVGMCQQRFKTLRLCKAGLLYWRLQAQTALIKASLPRGANEVHEEIARWKANAERSAQECLKWKSYASEAHSLAATVRTSAGELDMDRTQTIKLMRDTERAAEVQVRQARREAATVTTKRAVRAMVTNAYRVHFQRWQIRSQEQKVSANEERRLRGREEILEEKACAFIRAREAELEVEASKMKAQVQALIRRKRSDYRTDAAAAMLDEKELATISSRLWEVNKIFEPWAERERFGFDPAVTSSDSKLAEDKAKLKSLLYESEKREGTATRRVEGLERELGRKAAMVIEASEGKAVAQSAADEAELGREAALDSMRESKRDLGLALREVSLLRELAATYLTLSATYLTLSATYLMPGESPA